MNKDKTIQDNIKWLIDQYELELKRDDLELIEEDCYNNIIIELQHILWLDKKGAKCKE